MNVHDEIITGCRIDTAIYPHKKEQREKNMKNIHARSH